MSTARNGQLRTGKEGGSTKKERGARKIAGNACFDAVQALTTMNPSLRFLRIRGELRTL
jgi:hypothetical protein